MARHRDVDVVIVLKLLVVVPIITVTVLASALVVGYLAALAAVDASHTSLN